MTSSDSQLNDLKELLFVNGVVVVGVSGKIGSGKTTLCEQVQQHYTQNESGVQVHFRNFGDALKEQVAEHFGFPLDWCYSQHGKRQTIASVGLSVGEILQKWGTGLRQSVHDSVWLIAVDTWLRKQIATWSCSSLQVAQNDERAQPSPQSTNSVQNEEKKRKLHIVSASGTERQGYLRHIVLIGDVRFPNEFAYVGEQCAGVLVRLEGDPAHERARSNRDLEHISETALDDTDRYKPTVCICSDNVSIKDSVAIVVDVLRDHTDFWPLKHSLRQAEYYSTRLHPLLSAILSFRQARNGDALQQPARVLAKLLYDRCFSDADVAVSLLDQQQWLRLENFVEQFASDKCCPTEVPYWKEVWNRIK